MHSLCLGESAPRSRSRAPRYRWEDRMSTAVISRAKPVVIRLIDLVGVFGLLYVWRTTRSGVIENHATAPMPV